MFKLIYSDEPVATRLKPGRPRRDSVDSARTKTWARAVVVASGLSLRALDDRFGAPDSGTWSRYAAGLVSPVPDRVTEVEEAFPGTARYFSTLFWQAIRPRMLGYVDPRLLFEWIEEPLRSKFMLPPEERDELFWRKATKPVDVLVELLKMVRAHEEPFDVAQAIVAMTHEAVIRQDRDHFVYCVEAWAQYCVILEELPPHALLEYYFPDTVLVEFGRHLFAFVESHPYFLREHSRAELMFGT